MQEYLAQRAVFLAGAIPGRESARRLAEMTDGAVAELAQAASPHITRRWAVVALGSWGAGQLLPASDLDILILTESRSRGVRRFAESMLYPLWDAGLEVGHQVRDAAGQRTAMRADLKTRTAALTARPVAGDIEWAAKTLKSLCADAAKQSAATLRNLSARPRHGSPYLLEPDLKDGAGGRRDYDELTWTAAVLSASPQETPGALVELGVITGDELTALESAAATVTAARWQLQRAGFGNRMTLDSLEALDAVDAEAVQRALGETALVLAHARACVAGRAGQLHEAMAAADLLASLDAGESALDELELAAQAGRLDGLVPGFRELMSCRRPGLGHEWTVGAHSLRAAVLTAEIPPGGVLGASNSAVTDRRTLQVAALVHDIGKLEGGADHAELGAPRAREVATRFELGPSAEDAIARLTELHLVLAQTATRENLDDEDTILRCAERISDPALLAPLHVLTAVDSMATGPATWTPWVAALVGKLVGRVDFALSADSAGAGLAARGEITRREALAATSQCLDAERAFIEGAPLRYLASRDANSVARDARLVAELSGAAGGRGASIAVGPGPAQSTWTLTIAALDRPRLLARLSGAIALAGLDILSVDAYGTPGRVALDTFVVTSATRRAVTPETFSAVERFIEAALRDRLELATRLGEHAKHYPPRSDAPTSVRVSRSGLDTAVHVIAPDRPGLLHDLALAVSATGLDIRWARVQTVSGIARDTFHVVDEAGDPVDDDGVLGHLAMNIRQAV